MSLICLPLSTRFLYGNEKCYFLVTWPWPSTLEWSNLRIQFSFIFCLVAPESSNVLKQADIVWRELSILVDLANERLGNEIEW